MYQLTKYLPTKSIVLPLFLAQVPAGFPSPAIDYAKEDIDLAKELVKHPQATFLVRVTGDSMIGAGIHDKAILVVDRALKPKNNSIVVACVDGEFTVKRLSKTAGKWYLQPENKAYRPILISGNDDAVIWGVVTSAVNQFV